MLTHKNSCFLFSLRWNLRNSHIIGGKKPGFHGCSKGSVKESQWSWGCNSVVEHLPRMHKVLSSIPVLEKIRKDSSPIDTEL
jgi:hypothetical protein